MMKHDYSGILDFFRTGRLGELKLGMTVEDVVDYLGDDYRYSYRRSMMTNEIYDYYTCGILTLVFKKDYLEDIAIYLRKYPEYDLPDALDKNWLPVFCNMSLQKFYEFMIEYSIEVHVPIAREPKPALILSPHDINIHCEGVYYEGSSVDMIQCGDVLHKKQSPYTTTWEFPDYS